MNRNQIERLRETVGCEAVLESCGFAIDVKESTRRAVKYRRGGEIIIVTHAGKGWFNPLGDEKGDIFSLVTHLEGCGFLGGWARVAALSGVRTPVLNKLKAHRGPTNQGTIAQNWARRSSPWPGSGAWQYLRNQRSVPAAVIRTAVNQDVLREGPFGSVWAAHSDDAGRVSGWESRGPKWRGFATGGNKILFRLGVRGAPRLCVTEAAIDAMSLAALEGIRDGTLYLSTGGGWGPATAAALRQLAAGPDVQLVAATDANTQGDAYADRLRSFAEEVGCAWFRLRPPADDWNEILKQEVKQRSEGRFHK